MSNVVIVAIPKQDDYVWKISSEKVPHMTLCFLGDKAPMLPIFEFVSHAVETMKLSPLMLDVDFRGVLGPDEADVLFFRKRGWDMRKITEFRDQLLKDNTIKTAYESVTQYPMWTPHLTLGYPETPAKPDNRDYPGINWVDFDKIAVWDGDFQGPEIQLEHNFDDMEVAMSAEAGEAFIRHYGVKGMKWGERKDRHGEMGKRPGIQKFIDPQGHSLKSDIIKNVAGAIFLPLHIVTFPAEVRMWRAAGRGVKAKVIDSNEKRFAKKAMSPKNFVKIHNGAGPDVDKGIAALNKKWGNKDLTKDPVAQAKYDKEAYAMLQKAYQDSAKRIGNKAGTHHLEVHFKNDTDFSIHARAGAPAEAKHRVKHDATDGEDIFIEWPGKVVRNATGHIVKITIAGAGSAKHTVEAGEAFLMHHGVKGMKWGVRKQRSTPAHVPATAKSVVTNNRLSKTRVKSAGGQNHPATEDAIKVALIKQKLKKSGHASLTNEELRLLNDRLNLEVNAKALLAKAPKTPAEALVAQVKKDPIGSAKTTIKVSKDAQRFVQGRRRKR